MARRPALVGSVAVSCCLVTLLAGCSALGGEKEDAESGVDHQVYEGEAPAYARVTSVSDVAWEWEVPDEEVSLADVLPGRSGPVMVLGDGVVGLDGATGEELWRYRVEHGGLHGAWSTPEGKEILLAVPGGGPEATVLLDAGTGQLVAEHEGEVAVDLARAPVFTSQVAVAAPPDGLGSVEAFSLREGERAWTYEPPGREDGTDVLVEHVVSAGDAVVVIMADDPTDVEYESGDLMEQGMFVVGLDGETGEPLWEVEQEFTDETYRVAEHELSPGAEVLHLEVGVGDQQHEFLIDPTTGEEITGEVYRDRANRYPVTMLDEGYVDTLVDYDEGSVEYRYVSFEGELLEQLTVDARPGEGDIDPGLVSEEGLLWLDYLTEDDLARGPIEARFTGWGPDEESRVMDADMTANETWWLRPEGSPAADADAPVMVSVPGAVVVTEEGTGPWTVVGLT